MATKFVTVSIEIMHDSNLNQSQKFLLAEIEQLSQLDKGCIASNQHFSELIGITKENVSRNINELQTKGYINIEIVPGTRNHTRIVTLTTLVRPPYQSSKTPLLKQQETKENRTINKTVNRTIQKKPSLKIQIEEKLSEYQNINLEAFNEWIEYKKYKSITPITKLLNMLTKHDHFIQQEMVDNSIMNNYAGLFEPKGNKQQNTKPYAPVNGVTASQMIDMMAEEEERRINENRIS